MAQLLEAADSVLPQPTTPWATRRWMRGSVGLLVGLQVLLVVMVISAVWVISGHLREVALKHAHFQAHGQTHNLETRLTQSFDLLAVNLRAMTAEQPLLLESEYGFHDALSALQKRLPYVRSISALNERGQVVLSTSHHNIGHRLSLEPLLPQVAPRMSNVLRIGLPWHGRDFADGRPWSDLPPNEDAGGDAGFFPVTMVLPDKPEWTIVVAVNSDYFINLALAHLDPSVALQRMFTDEGRLLFSTALEERPGSLLPQEERGHEVLHRQAGGARWADAHGWPVLLTFRASSAYPWRVETLVSGQQVLQSWRTSTRNLWLGVALSMGLLLLCTGYLTWRVYRSQQREARLQEENRLAASVLAQSSDLIVIADSRQRIVKVNPAFEEGLGVPASQVLGRKLDSLKVHPEVAESLRGAWGVVATEGVWGGEVTHVRADGSTLTGWLKVSAITDETGRVSHYVGVLQDLSRIRADEATIRQLSQAVEQSPSSIVITSLEARIEYVNPEFCRTTGWSEQEVLGQNPRMLQSGLTNKATYRALWKSLLAGQVWQGEFINRKKDGSVYVESATVAPLLNGAGQMSNYMAIKYDITAAKEAEKALRLAASVIANTQEGVMICDAQTNIIDVNPAFTRISGYSREEVLGQRPSFLSSGSKHVEQNRQMWKALKEQGSWQGEFWNRHKSGGMYVAYSSVNAVQDENGEVSHYISVFSDITLLKHQQKHLENLAHFDALTGLPNRVLLADRLHQAMSRANHNRQSLAVCFVDLDGFKAVNDTHGHEAGDELLVTIAQRLQGHIRSADTAARMGGDEFVLLLSGIEQVSACLQTAQRLLDAISEPIVVAGSHTVYVSGSMGIAFYPSDSADADALLRYADLAMYQAKQAGRNRYVLFDPCMAQEGVSTPPPRGGIFLENQGLVLNALRLQRRCKAGF